ncbi:nuclear condensing complex subunit, c-term domain-containing protein [Ditylenchus destructor]|nr:nuclear condensing complex subunit, c-term domain-containing protein [Ditylenchus destructor]
MPPKRNRRRSFETPVDQQNSPSKSPEKHQIQAHLCSYLKSVYFSKDESSIRRSVEEISLLCRRAATNRIKSKAFYDELKFRLDLLVDNKDSQASRIRCLRAVATTAKRLCAEHNHPKLMEFLAEYCTNLSNSTSATVRHYICVLIGFLYKKESLKRSDDSSFELPSREYRLLYSVVGKRWKDGSVTVRREAIRTLAHIQDDEISADHEEAMEKTPKEMITSSTKDTSVECRIEAIKCLTMTEPNQTRLILNIAHQDNDWNVKKEALSKILSFDSLHAINSNQRMEVLEHLFGPSQSYLSEMVNELLIHWVKLAAEIECVNEKDETYEYDLCVGSLKFIEQLEPVKKPEICERALMLVFNTLAEKCASMTRFVQVMTSNADSLVVHRANYVKLLEIPTSLSEKSNLLFHWRCLVEVCNLVYENFEDKLSICMSKLVPTLQSYAEFAMEFVKLFGEKPALASQSRTMSHSRKKSEEEYRRFCLVQLFQIFHFLEKEPIGMQTWKDLLFSVLSNTEIQLYPDLVQEIAQSLTDDHFSEGDDAETQALHEFCDVISFLVQKTSNNLQSQSPNIFLEPTDGTENQQQNTYEMDGPTRSRCLTIFNAMLRSGKFTRLTAELQGLYDSIVAACHTSIQVEERTLAMECLGIISLLDREWAVINTYLIEKALNVDFKSVKLACLSVLTQLVFSYGIESVSRWYQGNVEEEINLHRFHENSLINTMIDYTSNQDQDIAFCATEALCKWCLMAGDVNEWRKVMLHLLVLSSSNEAKENPKLKACVNRFLLLFAAVSRKNQVLLAEVLIDALESLKNKDLQCTVGEINQNAVVALVISLTPLNVLDNNAAEREKGSAHSHFAHLVLTALENNADDYFASVYCKILSQLEMNEAMDAEECSNLLFLCTNVFNETLENAKDMKHIEQFMKRLSGMRDSLSTPSAIQDRRNSISTVANQTRVFSEAIRSTKTARSKNPLFTTPSSQRMRTPRMFSSRKKKSVTTLTNELCLEGSAESRKRFLPPSTLRFRPRFDRAAKANNKILNMDETIVEETDD